MGCTFIPNPGRMIRLKGTNRLAGTPPMPRARLSATFNPDTEEAARWRGMSLDA
jgi:hypothetical protein